MSKVLSMEEVLRAINRIPLYRLDPLPEIYSNANRKFIIVNEKSGEAIAMVSDKYLLVQPRRIFTRIAEVAFKMGKIHNVKTYWYNGIQCMELIFSERLYSIDSGYRWGIRATNSVTGKRSLTIHLMIWREECRNDMFLMFGNAILHIIYNLNKIEKLITKLPRLTKEYLDNLIKKNLNSIISKKELGKLLSYFPRYISGPVEIKLKKIDDLNRWLLANELSYIATREFKPLKRAKLLELIARKILLYP